MKKNILNFQEIQQKGIDLVKDCFDNHLPGSSEEMSFYSNSQKVYINYFVHAYSLDKVASYAKDLSDHLVYPFPEICNQNFANLAGEIHNFVAITEHSEEL